MKTAIKTYHRPDGVVGCGFYGEFGGLSQHSIAWPDQSATRMRHEDLQERQIAIKDLAVVPFGKRDLIDMADQPGEGHAAGCVDYVKANDPPDGVMPPDDIGPSTASEVLPVPPIDFPAPEDASPFDASTSEAANIRTALALFPDATNKEIIEMLNREKIEIASSQVTRERKAIAKAAEENESSE